MRVKLSIQYHTEREEICKKLIDILELDENNSILLCDLEKDIEKQTKILDMKDDIQKYFAVSCLTPFKPNPTCKRPYINILRGILRKQGYTFEGNTTFTKLEIGKYTTTTKYKMFRNK
jgi:hypothetical protein